MTSLWQELDHSGEEEWECPDDNVKLKKLENERVRISRGPQSRSRRRSRQDIEPATTAFDKGSIRGGEKGRKPLESGDDGWAERRHRSRFSVVGNQRRNWAAL